MSPNRALVFKEIPSGLPVPGKHLAVEEIPGDETTACPEGGLVLKSLYSSLDPYQRGRMRPPHVQSYYPALPVGETFTSRAIAQVVSSDNPQFRPGDTVIGMLSIQEVVILEAKSLPFVRLLDNPMSIEDIRAFLGPLGVPGLTAYGGLYEIGKPERGQTIFVSAASGAVGQMVGQIAKLEGLRVVGSVGSDEKLKFILDELGFDAGFNYKTESSLADALARVAPEGLDIFFDNVGGDHLDAALAHMKDHGRVVLCGTISDYNKAPEDRYPVRNTTYIFSKRLTVRGFLVSDKEIMEKYSAEHQRRVQGWLKDGTLRTKIWEVQGVENAPEAFLALFTGKNFGKVVLKY
ncbi:hypothetical protein DL546_008490 [Coniochaeta pulveracea]|uniref:Dehydrogenase FUB6 n=1 Tax=Coniochaeta pulveracea TaxID=177199 RepID=A0A420YEJ4_9PEZI|nr:hypothetical protein DL546_008490 [Coniochaeta pulveracea]